MMATWIPKQADVRNLGRRSAWLQSEIRLLLGYSDFEIFEVEKPSGVRKVCLRKDRAGMDWNVTAGAVAEFFVTGPAVILHPGESVKFLTGNVDTDY
jgi:hypothetical protein